MPILSAAALWLAVGVVESTPAHAQNVVDGVAAPTDIVGDSGMPANNPRVAGILASHPNQFVVICVAGCDGKPRAIQTLPKPTVTRSGEVVPTAGNMRKSVYGPPAPTTTTKTSNDVVCLAGCDTRPGQVLQRVADLPPVTQRAPVKPDADTTTPTPPKKSGKKSSGGSMWDDLIP